ELDVGLGTGELSLRLAQLRPVHRRIDLRDQLTLFDRRVEVDEQVRNLAGHLAAHIDADHRAERAAGRHVLLQIPAADRGNVVRWAMAARALTGRAQRQQQSADERKAQWGCWKDQRIRRPALPRSHHHFHPPPRAWYSATWLARRLKRACSKPCCAL